MATVPIPQGASLRPITQGGGAPIPIPSGATLQPISQEGEISNDVGNTVIVPKEDEDFADTMSRAAAYGKTVTPEQVNAEMATAPKKAAETLAAAPVIGAAGAAGLAGAGEAGAAAVSKAGDLINAGATALTPHIVRIGQWATENPRAAKALWEVIKATGYGAAGITALKKASDIGGR